MSVALQPGYFTSSLYVDQLRDDILGLVHQYVAEYFQFAPEQPFTLFKTIWSRGWMWLHLKVFEPRAREAFIRVTLRLFTERLSVAEAPLTRVIALFATYTFFTSQPTSSTPPLYHAKAIVIPLDMYVALLDLPSALGTPHLARLQPHTTHIISMLVAQNSFHILPSTDTYPLNPRTLPREVFRPEGYVDPNQAEGTKKKTGRPSKRDRIKRSKEALGALDKWLDKNTQVVQPPVPAVPSPSNQPEPAPVVSTPTRTLFTNPPMASRSKYQTQKRQLVDMIDPDHTPGQPADAIVRANQAVLARIRKIDQMAAAKGLEVGVEGGNRTGISRVERAVSELQLGGEDSDEDEDDVPVGRRSGLLELLDGAGIEGGARRKMDDAYLAQVGVTLGGPPAIIITEAAASIPLLPTSYPPSPVAPTPVAVSPVTPDPSSTASPSPAAPNPHSPAVALPPSPLSKEIEATQAQPANETPAPEQSTDAPSPPPPFSQQASENTGGDMEIDPLEEMTPAEASINPDVTTGDSFDLAGFGEVDMMQEFASGEGDVTPMTAQELQALLASLPTNLEHGPLEPQEEDPFTQMISGATQRQETFFMDVDGEGELNAVTDEDMTQFFDDVGGHEDFLKDKACLPEP